MRTEFLSLGEGGRMLLKENWGPTWEARVCPVRSRNTWDWVALSRPGRRGETVPTTPLLGHWMALGFVLTWGPLLKVVLLPCPR